jgi:hypothetical protein
MVATVNETTMANIARDMLGLQKKGKGDDKAFRSFFWAPISVLTTLWNKLVPLINVQGADPKHMLWVLVFVKFIVGWPDAKTYRKWCWYMLTKISSLKGDVIKLDKRFDNWNNISTCLMSLDGIDCIVNEPWPFDEKWFSQKFNGPGVKYEVGVCIATGHIVWINGLFVASKNDATIFKERLANLLADDEGVEVDAGYKGHAKFKTPTVAMSSVYRKQKSQVRSRHENVNSRLKIFNVLNIPFWHTNPRNKMLEKHGCCFDAVAVVTQMKFDAGDSLLYDVNYDVAYI